MIAVMSFNLRMDTEKDGTNSWPFRREAVVAVIKKYSPDILGIQEGLPHQVAYLEEFLPEYQRVGRGRDVDGGEHVALYLKKATLEIIEHGDFWLSDTPDVPGSRHWGNNCVRMVTYARVRHCASGKELLAVNTHLDHESLNAREKGAVAIDRFVEEYGLPAVLTGDMNDTPDSSPISFFVGGNGLEGRTGSWINAAAGFPDGGKGTFHGYGRVEERQVIDYIFTTGELQASSYQVIEDRPDGVYVSDHYPIFARIEWKEN